jgi:hypothetical protein
VYGPNWKSKSYAVKRAAGFRCEYVYSNGQRCRATSMLESHHTTYERLGRERGSDLVCLCRFHHMKVHGRLPRAR